MWDTILYMQSSLNVPSRKKHFIGYETDTFTFNLGRSALTLESIRFSMNMFQ